jgi:hypothetical protein
MGLIFDGIDLKTNYNFVVTNINGRGSPPVSRTMLELPRIDGAIELNSKLRSRNITISGYVYGTDASTKKDALIKLITQAYSQEKKLTFPDTNRSIYVKLAGEPIVLGPVGPVLNAQAYEITFRFTAQDPFFYGEDHDEVGFRIVKVNANSPTYLISPRRKFLKREPSIKIEPYTIVNLLGKYGDFEVDSDADGVADGWSAAGNMTLKELVSGINGNAQHISHTYNGGTQGLQFRFYPQQGHTYYAKTAMKTTTTDPVKPIGYGMTGSLLAYRDGYQLYWLFGAEGYTNVWTIRSGYYTETGTPDYGFLNVYIAAGFAGAHVGETYELWLDNFLLVDLTAMGSLPSGLQNFFSPAGITKWEELATTNNIVAADGTAKTGKEWLDLLLPYVNSVATLGWKWGE